MIVITIPIRLIGRSWLPTIIMTSATALLQFIVLSSANDFSMHFLANLLTPVRLNKWDF